MNAPHRGGQQFIPRPPSAGAGDPAPWHGRDLHMRSWSIGDVADLFANQREPVRENPFAPPGSREAAVLIGLYENGGDLLIAMIKRPSHSKDHPGEIAFPGGKFEPEFDADLAATARREAAEEIGIDETTVQMLGELDTGATVATAFLIAPFVAAIEPPQHGWIIDPGEVTEVLTPSVRELFHPDTYHQERWDIPDNPRWPMGARNHPMHFFALEEETIWGATGRIVRDFLCVLAGCEQEGNTIEAPSRGN